MRCRACGFDSWIRKIPWRRKWQPTPAFLPGESHGQKSLVVYNPCSHKEWDTTELWSKQNRHISDFTRQCYFDLVNSESLSVVSDSLQLHGLYSLALLRGIFPTQGSNPSLRHHMRIPYQLSHKESPRILAWVAYPFSSESSWLEISEGLLNCRRILTNWAIMEALIALLNSCRSIK